MQTIMLASLIWKHHYPEMLLKINENQKVLLVLNEHSSTHWPVLINASRIMLFIGRFGIKAYHLRHPINVFILQILNLDIAAIEIPKYLDRFPLNLQLGLLGHEWWERCASEVTIDLDFEITYFLDTTFYLHDLLIDGCRIKLIKLIAIPKIKSWM